MFITQNYSVYHTKFVVSFIIPRVQIYERLPIADENGHLVGGGSIELDRGCNTRNNRYYSLSPIIPFTQKILIYDVHVNFLLEGVMKRPQRMLDIIVYLKGRKEC